MFILRRDIIAYACIAAFAFAGGTAIHLNTVSGLDAARARYRAESHAASMAAATDAQAQFDSIYQNLRTISRLPSVKKTDRYATNINQDGIDTIQELYNNLASNVDVSEVYIVGKDLNSDEIDPVTQAPQTPILMFDDLISNDASGGATVTRQFEAEIYEYHLLHRQMLYYEAHNQTIATTDGFNIPMISGPQVVTCDNTVYNITLNDSDRTGMIFSVPFFGPDGNFKGTISAIIRVKAIRAVLPGQYFALVNRSYSALLVSKSGLPGPQALNAAAQAQPDPGLIYSEVIPLSVHDPRSTWEVWAGLPNSAFYTRPDVLGVHGFARSAYAVLTLLVLIALAVVMLMGRNAANLARAATALDALAHGDEQATLSGRERGGALGDLARAFEKFRAALAEKQQLELLAAAERETAEMERQKFDGERAASLAAQKQVVSVLAKALISFANGDLTWKITEWFSAEYKGLRMDFNQASSRMDATMRRVMTSTRAVEAGAAEIREATADLARRTEHQASQLEQAAATLDDVTGAVRKTSQNAATAAELAAAASTSANASASVVRNTVEAMNGIESSSHRIANIIGVIDEIAFQTNLLALNAGVEAARAGDAGRGFAVVATEVRALAARSADAAKEIKTIIAASGKQVGNGVKLVNETGETLLRITGQITQLTDLVRDIASSAQAQAGALNNVNAAVSQMDQTTQQNAAMVEEAAAASANLNTEASALSHLVDEFKMSDTPTEELEAAANRGFGPPTIAARVPALV